MQEPHSDAVPDPHLWSCNDPDSAEDEVISLIESVVWAEKPMVCVEIGTHIGKTAANIGEALLRNGRGHLHTFEIVPERADQAKATVNKELPVTVHQVRDTRYDPRQLAPINFLYVDGDLDNRDQSLEHWVPHMAKKGLVAIHDTLKYQQPYVAFLRFSRDRESLSFVTPRGISSSASKTRAVIPAYLRSEKDLRLLGKALSSLRETAKCAVTVVDDGSPGDYPQMLLKLCDGYEADCILKEENSGFSCTVNVGLRKALVENQNAVLINADIEFFRDGWLKIMESRKESVVGALLLYPNGFIQHAGIFYSVIRREFDHIYRMAPGGLPAAHQERVCPVTGALQFIRLECLQTVGLYDETFRMGYEDVDYAHRVFQSGRKCVYDPRVVAVHHESMFRSQDDGKGEQWFTESLLYLHKKWAGYDFSAHVPTLIAELDDD